MSSPANDALARIASEIVGEFELVAADATRRGFREGIRHVLAELERLDLTDEVAGVSQLDDVARRLRREHGA